MSYYMSGSNISRSHFPLAFFLPYFTLCVANTVCARTVLSVSLSRPELLVVPSAGLVGISVAYGVTGQMVSLVSSPYYFATSENRWAIFVPDYLPPYRVALFGLLGFLVFAAAWLSAASMDFWVLCVYPPLAFLTFLGLARLVAELGLVYVYYRVHLSEFVLKIFGGRILGQASVAVLYLVCGF